MHQFSKVLYFIINFRLAFTVCGLTVLKKKIKLGCCIEYQGHVSGRAHLLNLALFFRNGKFFPKDPLCRFLLTFYWQELKQYGQP